LQNILISRFLKLYTRHSRPVIFQAIVSAIIQSLLLLPSVFLIKKIFDTNIPNGDINGLILNSALIVALTVTQSFLMIAHRNIFLGIVKGSVKILQQDILKGLVKAERKFYDDADLASIINSSMTDVEQVDKMMDSILSVVIPQVTLFFIGVFIMMVYNPIIGITTLLLGVAGVIVQRKMRGTIYEDIRRYNEARDALTSYVNFLPDKQILTKMRNAEEVESALALGKSDNLIHQGTRTAKKGWTIRVTDELVVNISATLLIVLGSVQILTGTASYGNIFGLYFLIMFIKRTVTSVQSNRSILVDGVISLERIFELLDKLQKPRPHLVNTQHVRFQGNITASNVSFGYNGSVILTDVNFEIRRGEVVCLTGVNGSGKSSLINLLLGFYHPNSGVIMAEDRQYPEIDLGELRKKIGYVPQNQILINGTIRTNLTYGLKESVDILSQKLNPKLYRELMTGFPAGLDTPIGQGGRNLSNGQVQRISILRALISEPALLILDEPTNHLDSQSIITLIDEIRLLGISVVIISHHVVFKEIADRTYRLTDGKLERL
jgi:ATP-binding cassette subfamily B protein